MLGIGLAFLLEHMDDRWRSPEEVEQVSGVPTFGIIPEFKLSNSKKGRDCWTGFRGEGLSVPEEIRLTREEKSSHLPESSGGLVTVFDPANPVSEAYRTAY
jgi:hypothetical protein